MDDSTSNISSRKKKELVVHGNLCWFCKREGDEESWNGLGRLFKTQDVKIEGLPILYHEPCAAYCSGLGEIGSSGIDEKDIEKWFKYGERASNVGLKCAVCGLRGATAGCCMKQCSKTFHYTCARIAAFQGKAHFSVASRNVSCDKHTKWLAKPLEDEFMGMWMEGLGGWHGGLHQQAHHTWLPKLHSRHAEFQSKWLTPSNYPLTLLSPKPNAKLPGPEGVEVDALDALASLCAERMDNSDVRSADVPIKASVPQSPLGSTEQNVTSTALPSKALVAATSVAASGDAGVVQPSIGSAPADVNLDSTQPSMPNTQAISSSSQGLASAKPTDIHLPTVHQDVPTDIHLPTQHQDGQEAGANKSTEQELTSKDNQFCSTAQAMSAPAAMALRTGEGLSTSPSEQATDAITTAEGRVDSRPTAKRSQPVPDGDVNMGMAPLDGITFPTPLDSLRLLARTAVPSPAADEPSNNAPVAEQNCDGLLSSRLHRQRPAQSRHAQGEGSTSAVADVIDSNVKSRKRPSSAGGSSMLATSGGGGSTLSMEESENEEGDSELGIYEPAKKKPKKFRFLKEVYTDPVSKFIPSPPSRHPRPTPTPRLVKKRRTPTNSAQTSPTAMPMPNSGRITPSDRVPNRSRPSSRGNSTPSGSFDKHLPSLSHPSSQPGSPAHTLDIPSLAHDRSRSGELPDIKDPDQQHRSHMDQRVDDGLLRFDNPTSCGMPSSSALQFTGSDKIDGSVEIGMHDTGPMPSSSQPLHIDISQISGRNLIPGPPTSTLRDRCKPLHIDTSVPAIRGLVEPAPVSVTSVSPTSSGMKRTRVARKNTTGITSSSNNYSSMQPIQNHPAASEEDLIDVGDAHLLGSAPHTRMPQSRPFPHQMFPHSSPSIIQGNQSSMPAPASVVTGRRPSTSTGSLARTGSGPGGLGPQGMPYQDESQLAESDQYGDDGDLKFEDGPGMGVVVSAGQPSLLQQQQHPLHRTGSAGLKDLGNSDQSVSKVNMLLNNIQQVWVPEGMSGPEIAAMATQQNQQQGSIQFQPMLAQPTTIFTSSNMGMNGGQAVFAPIAGMTPHTLSLLPRLPYLPHKMMSFANGLTPTGRPSRSTRCAVCIIQKKGKCGTEQAPKNCLRRNQNLLGLGNGFGPAAGMHPIQFQMQHPAAAMLQVQGGQVVASPLVSPLVSPLPSPLPSPSNQYGSILLQQQPMGGVSNAMLMQTPHGLQIGGFSINSRQGVSDRLLSQHMRNAGVRVGSMQGNVSSGLSGAMLSDQIMDLTVNGAPLRAINPGNMQGGNPRGNHLGGFNLHKSMGSQNMMRGMQDDGFNLGGGIPITLSQSGHFMDHGLDNPMDDFQHMGAEWVQDPNGLNLIGSRVSASPHHHLLHPHEMLHDEMDHDIPGPESPFPRAQDRIQVFSGCVDLLPPLATGEERVLGITMHPRYAARFHAHMRSEAGRNAPLVAVPHSTAAFLASRNVNPELVVDSLRGLIQESLLDPDVQPRFGLPDDLPVRGVDRFIVPPTDARHGVHGQWGLRTNEDVAAGTAIGAYGSYAMFREDHERFATNPPPSYRSVAQATSRSVLDAMWELLVESNAVSSTLPASLGAGALSHASRGLGEEEVVMCALGYGNLTAMSNDPTIDPFDGIEGVKENAHVLMFLIHGWPLPIMVTLQDLPAHNEVLYSYGQAYWDLIAKCQQQLEELRG